MEPTAVTIAPATSTLNVDTSGNMAMIVICIAVIAFIWLYTYFDIRARKAK